METVKSCQNCAMGKIHYPNNTCEVCTSTELSMWQPNEQLKESYMESITELGKKYDSDKLRWSLLPLEALQDVVSVLEFGAKKYAPDNWKFVDNAEARYWDAAMRHLIAYKIENKTDSETGLSHLAHAICCLLFLSHFDNEDNNK